MAMFVSFSIPVIASVAPIGTYLPAFYASISSLTLAKIGTIFFFLKVFDVITDVLVSLLIDASPWKKNKYKPWIILSIPILCFASWVMYIPDPSKVNAFYLIVGGLILYAGFTLSSLSHQAWGSEAFPTDEGLATFFGYREIAVILGIIFAFLAPAIFEILYQADLQKKVNVAGELLLIIIPVFGLITLVSNNDVIPKQQRKSTLAQNLKSLRVLKKPILRPVMLANGAWFFATAAGTSITPFLLIHSFDLGDHLGRYFVIYFIGSLIFSRYWIKLVKNSGELTALRYGCVCIVVAAISLLVLYVFRVSEVLYVYAIMSGMPFAVGPLVNRMTAASLAENIQQQEDHAVRAKIFAFLIMTEKFGIAFGVFIALNMMDYLGFNTKTTIDPSVTVSVMMLYFSIVFVGVGAILWAYRNYGSKIGDLKNKQSSEIKLREKLS